MIKVGIVGATGYIGTELIRILSKHENVEIKFITSKSYIGRNYDSIYENYRKNFDMRCCEQDIEAMAELVDIIFVALPHGIASKEINSKIIGQAKIIDLGADFRLGSKDTYERWYRTEHFGESLLNDAVYGLCEWNRDEIKKSQLIANPGCYTTCSILSLAPLIREAVLVEESIVIDAKSGVTGAGRTLDLSTHYTECNESIKAYNLGSHRHTPEIEEQLSKLCGKNITVTFTPHLVPMNRGILVTAYARLKEKMTYEEVKKIYDKYYLNEYFIRFTKENIYPETRWVKGSNFCDIGLKVDERTGRVIIVGAIDNIIKGAAGQAIQNMNILFGLDETAGLKDISIFPV